MASEIKPLDRTFSTISGTPVEPLYGPEQLGDFDPARDLGAPGEFPYTRGIHRDMYRGRLWTMRQFSGFATPEETNRRYHYLLAQGQTGLSVAFDLPTLMGYDADHAMSEGEVGKCGVSISSLEDMEMLFRGIPLGDVTVSMTINSPAPVIWAMYLAVAEKQGVDWARRFGHAAERHSEGVHRAEGVHFSAAALDAAGDGHDRISARSILRDSIRFRSADIISARPVRRPCRSWRSRCGTDIEYVDWALERGPRDR